MADNKQQGDEGTVYARFVWLIGQLGARLGPVDHTLYLSKPVEEMLIEELDKRLATLEPKVGGGEEEEEPPTELQKSGGPTNLGECITINEDPEKGVPEAQRLTCPDCYSRLIPHPSGGGGVICSNPKCSYWFCF